MAGIRTGSSGSITNGGGSSSTQTQTTNALNMDPKSLAALQALIATLSAGGTTAQQTDRAARTQATKDTQTARSGYTKEAAFDDSQAAMTAQFNQALAQVLPTLVRAAEGSGTSQNALRALLTQDAAAKAAESAATLGMKAAIDYGNINSNLGQVLASLTGGADPAQAALLQALSIADGVQTKSTTTGTGTGGGVRTGGGGSGAPATASFAPSGLPEFGVRNPFGGMSFAAPASTQFGTGGLTPTMTPNAELTKTLSGFTF